MIDYITRTAGLQVDVSGRTVFGIVAPFNQPAQVFDSKGPSRPYTEVIARGAFARSIRERGHKITLVHEHQHDTTMPLGRATLLEERPEGLYGEFQVARTARGDEALQLIAERMLTGFSVRAGITRSQVNGRTQVTRHELKLVDVSLTGSPVYETAAVMGVRSRAGFDTPALSTEFAARRLNLILKAGEPL